MPRNASGTYSLPAGNPVVTGTTISSVWANTTLSDIGTALTGSLARNGDGGMAGQFKADAGVIGAPGISWSVETTSGFYRAGAGSFRFAIGGVDVWSIGATGVSSTRYLAGDGTAPLPAFSFTSDPNTGIYRIGIDYFGAAVGGVFAGGWLLNGTPQMVVVDGTAALPGLAFDGDRNTGFFRAGSDQFRVSVGGADAISWLLNGAVGQTLVSDGTAPIPSLSFINDTDTGFYRIGANNIGMTLSGVKMIDFATNGTVWSTTSAILVNTLTSTSTTAFLAHYLQNDTNSYFRMALGGSANAVAFIINGPTGQAGYFYTTSTNQPISIGTNAIERLRITDTAIISSFQIQDVDGSVGTPSYSFTADPNTGIYRVGADYMGFSAGGDFAFAVLNQGTLAQVVADDGSVAFPIYSFDSDRDTGFYRTTADQIAISLGGVTAGQIAQGTFTGTMTGMTGATTGTVNYQRVGNLVKLWVTSAIVGTSNTTSLTMTGLPAIVRPANTRETQSTVTDNSLSLLSVASVDSSGVIAFALARTGTVANRVDYAGSLFTNSGNKGVGVLWSISYPIS